MVWLPLRGHEICIERRIQCHIHQLKYFFFFKEAWITITAKLEEIWRSDSYVNLYLKSKKWTCLHPFTHNPLPPHTHIYYITISGILLMLLSRATTFNYVQYTLQHCHIYTYIHINIYSRMVRHLLTDTKPNSEEQPCGLSATKQPL